MYALLDTVNDHIKEKGISFKDIEISSDYFPISFNKAIVEYLINNNTTYTDTRIIKNYILHYEFGTTRLIVTGYDKYNTLVIFSDNATFDPYIRGKLLTESAVIKKANEIEFEMVNRLLQEKLITRRFLKKEEEVPCLSIDMIKSGDRINKYIDYLNYIYQSNLLKEQNNKNITFDYTSPIPSKNTPSYKTLSKTSKRLNTIIPTSLREETLEQYDYLYKGIAINNKTNEIDIISYLYKLKENCYILIMEPYIGDKHTKILHLYLEDTITKERFKEITKYYLELPRDTITMTKDLTRHSHTTIETFQKLISSVLTEDYHLINTITKAKILKAKKDFK